MVFIFVYNRLNCGRLTRSGISVKQCVKCRFSVNQCKCIVNYALSLKLVSYKAWKCGIIRSFNGGDYTVLNHEHIILGENSIAEIPYMFNSLFVLCVKVNLACWPCRKKTFIIATEIFRCKPWNFFEKCKFIVNTLQNMFAYRLVLGVQRDIYILVFKYPVKQKFWKVVRLRIKPCHEFGIFMHITCFAKFSQVCNGLVFQQVSEYYQWIKSCCQFFFRLHFSNPLLFIFTRTPPEKIHDYYFVITITSSPGCTSLLSSPRTSP